MPGIIERMMVEDTEYTLFSSMKFFEDHNDMKVYGLRVHKQVSNTPDLNEEELTDISSSFDTCKTIFDAMVINHALPVHTKDIVLDFLSI